MKSVPVIQEIIHVPMLNYIYVCLVKTESTTPFISALELRPLRNTTCVTQSGSLALFTRLDVGSLTNKTVRYPDYVYDRLWFPGLFFNSKWTDISTLQTVENHRDFLPPSTVMRSASRPKNTSEPMELIIEADDASLQFHLYFYFAELEKHEPNQSPLPGGRNSFSIFRTEDSALPPLLNAIEVYYVVELLQSLTEQEDVDAIIKIKSTYGIRRNWQGDPCAPQAFMWKGLNCSRNSNNPPKITFLDLSNNNLSGSVPDFLSQLSSLKALNLSRNKLTGIIPVDLFERWQDGSLLLSVSENPELCPSASCIRKKKKFVAPTVGSVAAFFVCAAALAIILWSLIRRKQKVLHESSASKNRKFKYSDTRITVNNFEKVLGKGGFGIVYHGYLHGNEVAVNMLSQSSAQGYRQFQAEVKLLLRVHHGNLTTLVGYCDEKARKGLIYEFMANGNLEEHLSGNNNNKLSWEERVRIALEAAQGLEYLDNGCKPPIVHRDVKTANILLNDKLQARIADFGLSKSSQIEECTHVSTGVAGTFGYLDPEYYESERLITKSDVFSFGVVLLEIITGKPAIARNNERTHISQCCENCYGMCFINFAGRPTVHQVVTELNECLASELARKIEGHGDETKDPDEIITVNLLTDSSPTSKIDVMSSLEWDKITHDDVAYYRV
ncbi:kinase, putative [Ricinus communis]|uniref:non-specific serine/threonine protein kinase n=1 Tax=Ricinus communis TaxID=3988 RepID=B9RQ83_RICCO|nr:kinase, putative [Ricinus communis]